MSFNNLDQPQHGIRIQAEWADIYVGWLFMPNSLMGALLLHFHFLPDSQAVAERIFRQLESVYLMKGKFRTSSAFAQDWYQADHDGFGCIRHFPLNRKAPEVANLISDLPSTVEEINNRLTAFLKKKLS